MGLPADKSAGGGGRMQKEAMRGTLWHDFIRVGPKVSQPSLDRLLAHDGLESIVFIGFD